MNTEDKEETEETKKTITSSMIVKYAQSTQTVCLYLCIAIFLIILFVLSPLNTYFLTGLFSKVIILLLLGYTIFYNISQTNKFANDFNITIFSGNWSTIKTNIAYSYIFTGFLLILMFTVAKKFF
jgi:hypothetical protein